ncbi:hypothetical protein C0995_015972 [Termitomyces sp. Mi166|nr:hypothetical protein C0995_015972 [Termitomyces sp. Mi166\
MWGMHKKETWCTEFRKTIISWEYTICTEEQVRLMHLTKLASKVETIKSASAVLGLGFGAPLSIVVAGEHELKKHQKTRKKKRRRHQLQYKRRMRKQERRMDPKLLGQLLLKLTDVVEDEELEGGEVISASNKVKIILASCKKREQIHQQHGMIDLAPGATIKAKGCLWKEVEQQSKKRSVIKSKEFVESEGEKETQAREIKQIKREHGEKRKSERKEETVRKKLATVRPQPTAGPSKPKASAPISVSKPTVVITKLPPIVFKLKEKTLVSPKAMVKTSRSEEEKGEMKWRLRRR